MGTNVFLFGLGFTKYVPEEIDRKDSIRVDVDGAHIFHQSKVSFAQSVLSSSSKRLHIMAWKSSRLNRLSSTHQSLMPVRKCRNCIVHMSNCRLKMRNKAYKNIGISNRARGDLSHAVEFRLTTFCLGFPTIFTKGC